MQRESRRTRLLSCLQRQSQSTAADHRRLESGCIRTCLVKRSACRRASRSRASAPITWVDPAGNNDYNGLSARLEHRFGHGLYFLNSFTWSNALGDSEQALGILHRLPRPPIRRTFTICAAECGPTSFDVKLINVTSVVYDLPFGKGGNLRSQHEPGARRVRRRLGVERHQYRQHGHANQCVLSAVGGATTSRASPSRLSRRGVPAAECLRQRHQPEHSAE